MERAQLDARVSSIDEREYRVWPSCRPKSTVVRSRDDMCDESEVLRGLGKLEKPSEEMRDDRIYSRETCSQEMSHALSLRPGGLIQAKECATAPEVNRALSCAIVQLTLRTRLDARNANVESSVTLWSRSVIDASPMVRAVMMRGGDRCENR